MYIYMYLHVTSSVGECMRWWETCGSSIFCHVFQVSWRVSLRSRSCAPSCVCVWAFFLSIICSGVCRVCRASPLCWSCFCAEPCSPCRTYTSTYFRWDQMQKDSKLHFDIWLWNIYFWWCTNILDICMRSTIFWDTTRALFTPIIISKMFYFLFLHAQKYLIKLLTLLIFRK